MISYMRSFLWNETRLHQHQTAEVGLPDQFHYYYSMGMSLMLEGVMSAMYHQCPNRENLQFDMVFIYVICILVLMKNRDLAHGNDNGNLSMALVSAFSTAFAGIFFDNRVVMAVLSVLAAVTIIPTYCFSIYHTGAWKETKTAYLKFVQLKYTLPADIGKSWGLRASVANAIIVSVFVGLSFKGYLDFVSLTFLVLSGNAVASTLTTYARLFKGGLLRHSQGHSHKIKSVLAWSFAGFSVFVWIFAIISYLSKTYDPSVTPAMSKSHNSECELLHFFDFHDLWHLTSAAGTFSAFMSILLLDGCFDSVERREIYQRTGSRHETTPTINA